MAQIENAAYERRSKSFAHSKKQVLQIDMTPMVDLGFLLITFFVFTTTISTPTATDLFMPKEGPESNLPNSLALTLLLSDNNKVYYYSGDWKEAENTGQVFETNYSTYQGLGKMIRQKQKEIEESGKFPEGKNGMMLLVKPSPGAEYKNVIDALDEVMINNIKKYAIIEPTDEELKFIKSKTSGQ
jgi:biopolymer transport protein ExbD